jgi:hypothetical protein
MVKIINTNCLSYFLRLIRPCLLLSVTNQILLASNCQTSNYWNYETLLLIQRILYKSANLKHYQVNGPLIRQLPIYSEHLNTKLFVVRFQMVEPFENRSSFKMANLA